MAEIGDFRTLGGNKLARVYVKTDDAQGGRTIVTGQRSINVFGRMAARLSEWFGVGKKRNENAGLELVGAVEREYGKQAADAVAAHLRTRALDGKPLSSRRVDICLRLAERFAVPAQVPNVAPRILEALRDPAKPHVAAIRQEITTAQVALPRAANSKAMLKQFEVVAHETVFRKAQMLEERCDAYVAIAEHPVWRDHVLRADTEMPTDQVLSAFLSEHGNAEPPILKLEVRRALAAETGPTETVKRYLDKALAVEHSPRGAEFEAVLAQAAGEVLGPGFDVVSIPLTGLKDDIVKRVRQLAIGNAQPVLPLTASQVAQVSIEAVRARCEALKNITHEISNSNLDERTQQLMGEIWFRSPDINVKQLKDQAIGCGHLNDCALAFAAGNVEEAISA